MALRKILTLDRTASPLVLEMATKPENLAWAFLLPRSIASLIDRSVPWVSHWTTGRHDGGGFAGAGHS